MILTSLVVVSAMTASMFSIDAMKWFPGDYFESAVRIPLERQVMTSWPGPARLLEIWETVDLSDNQRVTLLIGGAAYHDPALLPAYREAVVSESPRVREAAVDGYRRLLGDGRPNLSQGVDAASAQALADEMEFVSGLLRRRPLIGLWLQSLLAHEGSELPGWPEVRLDRPRSMCLAAIERLVTVHDLGLLVETFELSEDMSTRISLLRLIESLSLSRFIIKPTGARAAWGPHVFEDALAGFATSIGRWHQDGCVIDGEEVLRQNLAALGVVGVDPLAPEGCEIWVRLLQQGSASWMMMVSRQLFACGGPWVEFSALKPDDSASKDQRKRLKTWFDPHARSNAGPPE